METEHTGSRFLGFEAVFHDTGPKPSCCSELGNLFQKIVMAIEKEREAPGKGIHVQASLYGSINIGYAVCQGKGYLLDS
jgi:hypothetical protein